MLLMASCHPIMCLLLQTDAVVHKRGKKKDFLLCVLPVNDCEIGNIYWGGNTDWTLTFWLNDTHSKAETVCICKAALFAFEPSEMFYIY